MNEVSLSLTVVAGEFPYPPNHGGRFDIWHRLRALNALGVRLQLVCWYSPLWGGRPQEAHLDAVGSVVDDLVVLPISVGPMALLRRLALLRRMPSHAASRLPSGPAWQVLLDRVQQFEPDGIWQDNLWGGATAARLAGAMQLPHWVRSHNVEHRYMAEQFRLAVGLKDRLRIGLACVGIQRFETDILRGATRVFDISMSDLQWWKTQGVRDAQWLPPTCPSALTEPAAAGEAAAPAGLGTGFALYVGNLHTQNNVDGLKWLLTRVWPTVRERMPQARLVLGGSNPRHDLTELVKRTPGVDLVANPPEVAPLYRQAGALVNPVFAGSGVNIKTVEMLHTDLPIACTPVGAGGLPAEACRSLNVTDDAARFAALLVDALQGRLVVEADLRQQARAHFGPQALAALIETLRQDLREHRR